MKEGERERKRPDLVAAERGGDWTQAMDGEGDPVHATLEQAHYWSQIYSEILGMEEKVLSRIRQLMATQSAQVQREVELTNVPVVVAQAERFRQRLGYWDDRVKELDGGPKRDGHATLRGHDGHATLRGHDGHATLRGHDGHATLDGHGHLTLDGHDGHLTLDGNDGHATVDGHDGQTRLDGHAGKDGRRKPDGRKNPGSR